MGGSRPRCFSGEASKKKIFEDNVQDGGGKFFSQNVPIYLYLGMKCLIFDYPRLEFDSIVRDDHCQA